MEPQRNDDKRAVQQKTSDDDFLLHPSLVDEMESSGVAARLN